MVNDQDARLDAAFRALAHPARRNILERLARGGATAGELAEPLDMTLPAVSKHLRVLEDAGLLQRRIDGRVHRMGLDPGPLREATQWLEEHRSFWEPRLDALVRYLEEKTGNEKEASWTHRKPRRTSRSASNDGSPRRPSGSSRRGRRRRS